MQFLEEVSFTDGKIYVRGKLAARGKGKRADYILYYKPNIPVAIIEAKDNTHSMRAGIQQALEYARILDIPCVFSSNGDGFLFHDRSLVIPEGNLRRHADAAFVIAEGKPQRHEGSHNWTTHMTSQVVFDDDKSGVNTTSQIAFGNDKRGKIDIDHAERMRSALTSRVLGTDLAAANSKYVIQITGDNDEGSSFLSFPEGITNPEERHPVIATTSELMTTGVDAQTCKVIVLDANIASMTKFKQIIGRGTRINEEYGKHRFLSFPKGTWNVTDLFADLPSTRDDPILPPRTYGEDDDLSTLIEEEAEALADLPLIDEETGTEIEVQPPKTKDFFGEPPVTGHANKVYVNGVDVTMLVSREMYFDQDGKPITSSLKDYTRLLLKGQYASLDAFLSRWNKSKGCVLSKNIHILRTVRFNTFAKF